VQRSVKIDHVLKNVERLLSMEPRITQTTQEVSELAPIERSIDAIELTDQDLKNVTGAWGHFGHFGHFGQFRNSTAIAINNVAIAGNRSIALSTVAFAG
jgi:hypothetical protein